MERLTITRALPSLALHPPLSPPPGDAEVRHSMLLARRKRFFPPQVRFPVVWSRRYAHSALLGIPNSITVTNKFFPAKLPFPLIQNKNCWL